MFKHRRYSRAGAIAAGAAGAVLGKGIQHLKRTFGQFNSGSGSGVSMPKNRNVRRKNNAVAKKNAGVRKRKARKQRSIGSRSTVDYTQGLNQGNQFTQHTRRYIRQGRKLKPFRFLQAVERSRGTGIIDLGHRQYGNFGAASTVAKSLGLNSYGGSNHYYPIYIFELTNANRTSANTYNVPAAMRLYSPTGASPNWQWTPVNTKELDGTETNSVTSNTIVGKGCIDRNIIFQRSLLEWVSMQFNFTGPTTRPAKVSVELCSLREQWADPFQASYGGGLGPNPESYQRYWARQAAMLVENPIHKLPEYTGKKPYRVICRRVLEFQPTSTTESDTRGHIQTLKWFKRIGKVLDYTQRDQQTMSTADVESALVPSHTAGLVDNVSPWARQSQRLFVIVKSTCWDLDTSADPGNSSTNTRFEWNLCARHRVAACSEQAAFP